MVTQRQGKTRWRAVAKLSSLLTMAMLQNGYACQAGYMSVSPAPAEFSCQKMNLVAAAPVPVISDQDCPAGSQNVGAVGTPNPCRKAIDGHVEIVLRAGDRCPVGYSRFVDLSGSPACRVPPKFNAESDPNLNGY